MGSLPIGSNGSRLARFIVVFMTATPAFGPNLTPRDHKCMLTLNIFWASGRQVWRLNLQQSDADKTPNCMHSGQIEIEVDFSLHVENGASFVLMS